MNKQSLCSPGWHKKLAGGAGSVASGNDDFKIDCQDHLGFWRGELEQWMPENIFDAHIHLGCREFMTRNFSPDRLAIPLSTFGHMTIEELDEIYIQLYEGKNITGMFAFPFPQKEIDKNAANRYIIELMKHDKRVNGFILSDSAGITDVINTFEAAEKEGVRFFGIKPYFDLLGKRRGETALNELLPDKLLSFVNSEKLIITLHSPEGGIGDKNLLESLARIVDKFPDIKIILAHMGVYLKESDFEFFMESDLPDCENVFFDTSFASEKTVYEAALSHSGIRKRLLFASDNPFGLIVGGEFFTESGAAVLMTRDKYTWSEDCTYDYNMTYNTYHCMKALKDAFENAEKDFSKREEIKRDIFLNNALSLLARSKR